MAVTIFDPVKILCDVTEKLYPDLVVGIQFNPDLVKSGSLARRFWRWARRKPPGNPGCITFPDDGSMPIIDISTHIPYFAVLEIVAHELAHAIVGSEAGHGPKWGKAFEELHKEYLKAIGETS